ncbi:MAG: helicase-related protein [Verrucomicrobiota bacterium]|nr:helicase-related protein [Verrucomicrobiota bacterium]
MVRPIGGSAREICGVLKTLANTLAYSLPHERIQASKFPLPDPNSVQDHTAVRLLMQAARLLLRDGAAPFRSFGHLSVRPRPYQCVPLLMALRLETVRLLIADDVGIGKTIEAAMIAREMLDRGLIQRIAVLCPPYLCDQWQKELAEKFHIEAAVIRSGTVARLERQTPADRSIFEHHRHFVASIDLVKGDRYRAAFLQYCPELVIVDEVHGAAQPAGGKHARAQQLRHELLCDVAKNTKRHLILLTATPHCGLEEPFLSILGLLRPEFRTLNLSSLTDSQREQLAKHFIQRRRADVQHWMGKETRFPVRDVTNAEQPYSFSPDYLQLYEDVYEFARQMVQSAVTLTGWRRRMRFWSALALLRCVASSPAAAEAALLKRATAGAPGAIPLEALDSASDEELEAAFHPVVHDPTDAEAVADTGPASVFDAQEQDNSWPEADRRRLRDFARRARGLRGQPDAKLQKLIEVITGLLDEGYHPIVWCRYLATADYVAEELQRRFPHARIASITGALSEDERKLKVAELCQAPRRVLVATDCLSEGINLQEHFNAVVHYDLPWNPNRLEQREGRVDRFGQPSEKVKAVLIYGRDNPVDGAVLEVLLRKARQIHRTLGIYVPVPMDSESVLEAVLNSLFAQARSDRAQLTLFDEAGEANHLTKLVHEKWGIAAEREKETRSRFAQRAIKPEEIERELAETDAVLGRPEDVAAFLQDAAQRLGFTLRRLRNGVVEIHTLQLPPAVRQRIGTVPDWWKITFESPTPENATFIGRNHPLIEGLAEHIFDLAFHPPNSAAPAARCGAICTDAVQKRTTLYLLRLRFLIHETNGNAPTLAEETITWVFEGAPPNSTPLPPDHARRLLDTAAPVANLDPAEKRRALADALAAWPAVEPDIRQLITDRAKHLQATHQRVRQLLKHASTRFEPHFPPDLLGILVLVPKLPEAKP